MTSITKMSDVTHTNIVQDTQESTPLPGHYNLRMINKTFQLLSFLKLPHCGIW
jgi:hypothetical protein